MGSVVSLNRDLRIWFVSNFLWGVGFGLYIYIWPLYIRELGGKPVHIGILISSSLLITTLSYIPGGLLADRFDRKKIVLAGWAVATPSTLIFAEASSWDDLLPGIALYYSSFMAIPASTAYIVHSAPRDRVMSAYGVVSSAYPLGYIIGPLVGAQVLAFASFRWLFRLSFILYLTSTIALLFLTSQAPGRRSSTRATGKVRALGLLVKDRQLLFWTILMSWILFNMYAAAPYVAPFLQDVSGLSLVWIQALGSVRAVGDALLKGLLGRMGDKYGKAKAVLASLALYSFATVILLSFKDLAPITVSLLFIGVVPATLTLGQSIIGSLSPAERKGTLISVYLTVEGMALASAPYLGGLLYAISPYSPLIASAALMVGPAALLLAHSSRLKLRPSLAASWNDCRICQRIYQQHRA